MTSAVISLRLVRDFLSAKLGLLKWFDWTLLRLVRDFLSAKLSSRASISQSLLRLVRDFARGRAATYSRSQADCIPEEFRAIGLERGRSGPECRISECARSLIRFNELNLLGSWPMRGKFDIIFCRNVVIYFDEQTQDEIWRRFADLLPQDGHLLIGHSERIMTDRHPFELVAQTAYRKRGS